MPFKRKRSVRRLGARKIYRKRAATTKRRARVLTKKIKSVILKTTETKYAGAIVSSFAVPSLNSTLNVIPLNDIDNWKSFATENPQNFRVGQEYILSRFHIKHDIGNVVQTTGAAIVPLYFRCMIIEARNMAGTAAPASGTQMWRGVEDLNTSFTAISPINQCMWYKIDWKQYRTVFDRKWMIGNNGNGQDVKNIEFTVPINKKIKCNAGSEGNAQQSRRYFMLFFAFDPRYPVGGTYLNNFQWQAIFKDP